MWDLSEAAKKEIEELYQHFLPLIKDVSEEELYSRIYTGYCFGEGGFPLFTIQAWESVFGLRDDILPDSIFENWEDYRKYKGNYEMKERSTHKKSKTDSL